MGDSRVRVWVRRGLVTIVLLALLAGAGLLGASFIPRWWSHRVGAQVGGSIAAGIFIGLFYGFVFTALPLLVLWRGLRRRRRWRVWAAWVAAAVLVALPNLFTLGIVLGGGKASHAAERTLDVEAPAFRGGSLAGALVAVAVVALFVYLVVSGRRSRLKLRRLRAKVEAEQQPVEGKR
jgi:hypothetical protein